MITYEPLKKYTRYSLPLTIEQLFGIICAGDGLSNQRHLCEQISEFTYLPDSVSIEFFQDLDDDDVDPTVDIFYSVEARDDTPEFHAKIADIINWHVVPINVLTLK
jgi:hypothetical protein